MADFERFQPTLAHKFTAWLHQRGWLNRVYTQNVDGLHLHPSLNIPDELVVECHGSLRNPAEPLVLYGDELPLTLVCLVMAICGCFINSKILSLYLLPKTQLSFPILFQYFLVTQCLPLFGCLLSAHLRNLLWVK